MQDAAGGAEAANAVHCLVASESQIAIDCNFLSIPENRVHGGIHRLGSLLFLFPG
jgi:hypothetical protein